MPSRSELHRVAQSIWLERHSQASLPRPADDRLAWFVREAWPSPATDANLTEGMLDAATSLYLAVESDQVVIFGDGIETDFVVASWGSGSRSTRDR